MVIKPTPVRASSVVNVGNSSSNSGNITITSSSTGNCKQSVSQNQHLSSAVTSSAASTISNVPVASKTSSASHHHPHSHHHHIVSPIVLTAQCGNFATVAAASIQHHPATSASYSNKITTGRKKFS